MGGSKYRYGIYRLRDEGLVHDAVESDTVLPIGLHFVQHNSYVGYNQLIAIWFCYEFLTCQNLSKFAVIKKKFNRHCAANFRKNQCLKLCL